MDTEKRNSFGLFDAPARFIEQESVVLSPEDIERQLDAGAFFMSREKALAEGFLNPHDAGSVVVYIQEAV